MSAKGSTEEYCIPSALPGVYNIFMLLLQVKYVTLFHDMICKIFNWVLLILIVHYHWIVFLFYTKINNNFWCSIYRITGHVALAVNYLDNYPDAISSHHNSFKGGEPNLKMKSIYAIFKWVTITWNRWKGTWPSSHYRISIEFEIRSKFGVL